MKTLHIPHTSKEFIQTWKLLLQQPKWKKKTRNALRLSMKKLAAVSEQEAIEMMQNTIENNWQGIFPINKKQNHGTTNFREKNNRIDELSQFSKSMDRLFGVGEDKTTC